MTREELHNILAEAGVESPSKLLISALLNKFNDEKQEAVKIAQEDAVKKVKEEYKDYKSPDDLKVLNEKIANLENETATLKDASAKSVRSSKYKDKGINEKWFDYADSLLKDEKDFDVKLDEFITNNPELLATKKTEEPKIKKFANPEPNPPKNEAPKSLYEALQNHYTSEK